MTKLKRNYKLQITPCSFDEGHFTQNNLLFSSFQKQGTSQGPKKTDSSKSKYQDGNRSGSKSDDEDSLMLPPSFSDVDIDCSSLESCFEGDRELGSPNLEDDFQNNDKEQQKEPKMLLHHTERLVQSISFC